MKQLTTRQFSELRTILRADDPDADLCRRQIDEAARGIYGLVIYENINGWCYRADTNLINNGMKISQNFGHGSEGREKAITAAKESGRKFRVEKPVNWANTGFSTIPVTPDDADCRDIESSPHFDHPGEAGTSHWETGIHKPIRH